ncbi:MAG: hypothetical protein WEA09_03570 [Gemmatimonadota bacterium]
MGSSDLDFLIPVFGILLVMIPVLGVTTILTLKFGLRPFVETLGREMRGVDKEAQGRLEAQVTELSEQLGAVTQEMRELRETQDFDRKLLADTAKAEEGLKAGPG